MSKTLVQLACHPNCVKPMLCHPKFMAVWTKCAKHPNAEIRQRAAVVFSQCHENQLGYVRCRVGASHTTVYG